MKMLSSLSFCLPRPIPSLLSSGNGSWKPNSSSSSTLKLRLAAVKAGHDHQIQLPECLIPELMPKHVAVIMDGNRRWAKNRGLPPLEGHKAGTEGLKKLVRQCKDYGVKVLTLFAFSTENWARSEDEVKGLMKTFEDTALSELGELMRNGARLVVLGNRSKLPGSMVKMISRVEELTKDNKRGDIVIAFNYGSRYEITEAAKKVATKVKDGVLELEDINETIFEQHLQTNRIEFPNPDLLIRTSGELRLSNFMLWQLAHTQLFFSNKLFPDFDHKDLVHALTAYQRSQTHHH